MSHLRTQVNTLQMHYKCISNTSKYINIIFVNYFKFIKNIKIKYIYTILYLSYLVSDFWNSCIQRIKFNLFQIWHFIQTPKLTCSLEGQDKPCPVCHSMRTKEPPIHPGNVLVRKIPSFFYKYLIQQFVKFGGILKVNFQITSFSPDCFYLSVYTAPWL